MADRVQQLAVKVEWLDRHQIDDADRHALQEQRRALGDEDISVFRSILVRRTDDLDGRDQVSPAPRIEDPNLVLVVIGSSRFHGDAGLSRGPHGGRHPAIPFRHPGQRRSPVLLERSGIDLDLRPGMDARLGHISGRKLPSQLLDDDRRPLTVESLPRGDQVQWRSKVIAERHDASLQATFYRLFAIVVAAPVFLAPPLLSTTDIDVPIQ